MVGGSCYDWFSFLLNGVTEYCFRLFFNGRTKCLKGDALFNVINFPAGYLIDDMCIAVSAHAQVGRYKTMGMQFDILYKDGRAIYINGIITLYLE